MASCKTQNFILPDLCRSRLVIPNGAHCLYAVGGAYLTLESPGFSGQLNTWGECSLKLQHSIFSTNSIPYESRHLQLKFETLLNL